MAHQTYVVQEKIRGKWVSHVPTKSFNVAKRSLCDRSTMTRKQKRVVRIDSRTGSETLIRMTCKR